MNRLKDCWQLLNLPCEGMSHLASESLDRELTRGERAALRLHMFYCLAYRRALRGLAGRLEIDDPLSGAGLPDDVREEIKRSLRGN